MWRKKGFWPNLGWVEIETIGQSVCSQWPWEGNSSSLKQGGSQHWRLSCPGSCELPQPFMSPRGDFLSPFCNTRCLYVSVSVYTVFFSFFSCWMGLKESQFPPRSGGILDQMHRWFCFFNLFEFWLRWVFVTAYGLSLVAVSLGYSVAVPGLLIAVVSRCERGLLGMQAE